MDSDDHLSLLSETISTHAKKLAHEEWEKEYGSVLSQIFKNAGIPDTLNIDGREIPVESVEKVIREAFLQASTKKLTAKLTDQIVQAAFKKVMDEEARLGSLDLTALQPQPQPTAKPHSRKLYLEVRRTDARADSCYQGDIGQLDKMQDTILW